jgi:signal peptidase II
MQQVKSKSLTPGLPNRSWLLFSVFATAVFALDQISKAIIKANFNEFDSMTVLPGVLRFTLVYNDRAAFSLGGSSTWPFTLISSIAAIAIVLLSRKFTSQSWLTLAGVGLGGVLGNLCDRIFQAPGFPSGRVIDFIAIPFNFPIFNLADSAISVTACVVVIRVLRGDRIGHNSRVAASQSESK